MNKQEFLGELRRGLSGLPESDVAERLAFYEEMIDDRVEEGMSEDEATKCIGSIDSVIAQIVSEVPLTRFVKEKVTPKRRLKAWEIVLIVLGSPIWLSLSLAAAAVIFALYAVLWAVIVSFWAIFAALAVFSVSAASVGVLFIVRGNVLSGLAVIAAGLVCAGLTVFAFFGCKAATRGIYFLTKKLGRGIKGMFMGKERA